MAQEFIGGSGIVGPPLSIGRSGDFDSILDGSDVRRGPDGSVTSDADLSPAQVIEVIRGWSDLTRDHDAPDRRIFDLSPGIGGVERALAPADNPIFEFDTWQRYLDVLPFIFMPVGPDGADAVPISVNSGQGMTPVSIGGRLLHLGNPATLDWTGGLADTSCFVPPRLETGDLATDVLVARSSMVLLSSVDTLKAEAAGGVAYRYESCSNDVAASPPRHCSGLLGADGRTVWTAHHCVMSPDLKMVGEALFGLETGQTGSCDANTSLRVVSLLGLIYDDFQVPVSTIRTCRTVTRLSLDVVRVELSDPLPVALQPEVLPHYWRLPQPGELERLLVPDRRLYGLGFQQSARLEDLMGGRLFPIPYCARTIAKLIPKYSNLPEPADLTSAGAAIVARSSTTAMHYSGFACMSLDTLNGASGGPVFAVDNDGVSLILVGVISGAAWVDFDMECLSTVNITPLSDTCGVAPDGLLNVLALVPEAEFVNPDIDCSRLVEMVLGDGLEADRQSALKSLLMRGSTCAGSVGAWARHVTTEEWNEGNSPSLSMLLALGNAAPGHPGLSDALHHLAGRDRPELMKAPISTLTEFPSEVPLNRLDDCDAPADEWEIQHDPSWEEALAVIRTGSGADYTAFFFSNDGAYHLQTDCVVTPLVESATPDRLRALADNIGGGYPAAFDTVGRVFGEVGRTRPDIAPVSNAILGEVIRGLTVEELWREENIDLLTAALKSIGPARTELARMVAAHLPSLPHDTAFNDHTVYSMCELIGAFGADVVEPVVMQAVAAYVTSLREAYGPDDYRHEMCLVSLINGLTLGGYEGPVGLDLIEAAVHEAEAQSVAPPSGENNEILAFLVKRGSAQAAALLGRYLRSDWPERNGAVSTANHTLFLLRQMGPAARSELPLILEFIETADFWGHDSLVLEGITAALMISGWPALADLGSSLDLAEPVPWQNAFSALARTAPGTAAQVATRLTVTYLTYDGPAWEVALIRAMAEAGPAATPALTVLARSADHTVRESAFLSLAEVLSTDAGEGPFSAASALCVELTTDSVCATAAAVTSSTASNGR